ncbi:MAG: dTDP-4-dehydrorhamnose reductase [Hormoscilla sp. GM7CHS1pb]|nr:dTDP-4-dehydrorhamnose reductase [Hormoscilla sp. GM7CHS1pb]
MKRILLLGVKGQLGQELSRTLSSLGDVTGVGRETVDLERPDDIRRIMQEIKPDLVVNAAAYTAVDKAEQEPERAIAVNGTAPGIIAEAAVDLGSTLVHVSTDYVFDGNNNCPYRETDSTKPMNAYGESKLKGELAIQASGVNYIILRTAWVYGAGPTGNFVKTMLRLGAQRDELRVVYDQVGSPTSTRYLAGAIASLIAKEAAGGIYHYTNSGVASWYDLAVAIFAEAKELGFPLKVQRVIPITTAEYPTPARRPPYSVLNIGKISSVLGGLPPHWRNALREMLPELISVIS